jgi:hypothetical protein
VNARERALELIEEWRHYRTLVPKDVFDAAIDLGITKEHLAQGFRDLEARLLDGATDEVIAEWIQTHGAIYQRFRDGIMISVLKNGTTGINTIS